jgi:predicted ATPase
LRASQASRSKCDLIGRDAELAELAGHVESGTALITVVGPAGVGKTALVRQLTTPSASGREFLSQSAEPGASTSLLCDVSEATTLATFLSTLAKALGVPFGSERDLTRLGAALAARQLVVLDNFEHLVELARATLERWLLAAPELTLIVTSRQRLGLDQEQVLELRPLKLPQSDADILGSDAVTLWLLRARAVDPSYQPTDLQTIRSLAHELDGLPLAIELAAARCGVLSPPALLERIRSHRFVVLRKGTRGADTRHRALKAALDVSWNLLDDDERSALEQCSVFRGGFSLEAAEAVLRLDAGARPILDVLQGLHDKFLVATRDPEDDLGDRRFVLALSVRAYAEEKLRDGPSRAAARRRHAQAHCALAEQLGEAMAGAGSVAAHRRLAAERENFLAAIAFCAGPSDAETAAETDAETNLRFFVALEEHLTFQGLLVAELPSIERTAEQLESAPPDRLARALILRGAVRLAAGNIAGGEQDGKRALELARASVRELEPRAASVVANAAIRQGRANDAAAAMELALKAAEREGDPRVLARALAGQASVARTRGSSREALALLDRALLLLHESDCMRWRLIPQRLFSLLDEGELELVRMECARVLAAQSDPFAAFIRAEVLIVLTDAELELGATERALDLGQQALSFAHANGDAWRAAWARTYVTAAMRELGRGREASELLDEAIEGLARHGEPVFAQAFTAVAGALDADSGRIESARRRLESATQALATRGGIWRTMTDVCTGHLDWACAKISANEGRNEEAEQLRASARRRLEAALGARDHRLRWAVRVLDRTVRGAAVRLREDAPVLRLEREGRWIEPPTGARLACDRRPVLRRLVLALANARVTSPGRPVPWSELVAHGWPGEKILQDAARNRLYMMISRIREVGVGRALRAEGDGYLLGPEVRVELVD